MTIVGQVDRLRHRVQTATDDPRVVITRCGQKMTFSGRRAEKAVLECPKCYWRAG